MGRKRADVEATGSPPPAGAGGNRTSSGPTTSGRGKVKRGDKPRAVKRALAKGMTSPSEIADYLRREQGIEITPGHVTNIKSKLKREAAGKGKGLEGHPRGQGQPAPDQAVRPAARETASSSGSGLT